MINKLIILFLFIIFIYTFCGCIGNDDNNNSNSDKLEINIENAQVSEFSYNELNNQTDFNFKYEFTWKNLKHTNGSVKFIIKFIKNNEIYLTWEYQLGFIKDYSGSVQGQIIGSIDGDQPIPERYKVEIKWKDELMDDFEREYDN